MEVSLNDTMVPIQFAEEWYGPWSELFSNRAIIWRWIVAVTTLISVGMGIPGNILVFFAVATCKELQKLSNVFIVNLAVCDTLVMIMDSFVFFGLIQGQAFWDERPWFCEFSGTVCIVSCFGSLWTMAMIAVNRYLYIKSQAMYNRIFSKTGTAISLIIIWIFVYILDMPNATYVGIASHVYNPAALHCDFSFGNWWYNTIFYTGFAYVLPLIAILSCYAGIYRLATNTSGTMKLSEKRQQEQKQLVRSLLVLLFWFVITWTPLAALYAIEYNLKAPFEVHLVLETWAHFNSAVNPIVYGVTHQGFRRAYKKILSRMFCGATVEDTDNTARGGGGGATLSTNANTNTLATRRNTPVPPRAISSPM